MKKTKDHISLTVFFGVLTLISFLGLLVTKYMLDQTCPQLPFGLSLICMANPKYQELFQIHQFFYNLTIVFCIIFVLLLLISPLLKDEKEWEYAKNQR